MTAQRPFWTALLTMAAVGGLILAGQMVLSAPIMPTWRGLLIVIIGLIPELLGILGPVALLVGSLAATQTWLDGGELRGLSATGVGLGPLVRTALLWGTLVGGGVAMCTHILGPKGRTVARTVVSRTLWDAPLPSGVRLQLGEIFIGVAPTGSSGAGVVVAADDWVAWADAGVLEEQGIRLTGGQARSLDDSWRIRFDSAHWPLPSTRLVPHNFDRTSGELRRHIAAQQADGKDSGRAELTLLKRSTLALSAPLFALLGLGISVTCRRPMVSAVASVLGIWLLQRVADHGLSTFGAPMMAVMPLLALAVAVLPMLVRLGRPS